MIYIFLFFKDECLWNPRDRNSVLRQIRIFRVGSATFWLHFIHFQSQFLKPLTSRKSHAGLTLSSFEEEGKWELLGIECTGSCSVPRDFPECFLCIFTLPSPSLPYICFHRTLHFFFFQSPSFRCKTKKKKTKTHRTPALQPMHVVKVLWDNFGNIALKKLHWRAWFACFVLN